MRKVSSLLSILVILSLLLAACGGGAAPADTTAPAAAAPTEAPPAEAAAEPSPTPEGQDENVAEAVVAGDLLPPVLVEPCAAGSCPFEGQTVTVIVNTAGEKGPIEGPFHEVRDEFEKATGAKLEIVGVPFAEHFPKFIDDCATETSTYDTSIAGAWWLGDFIANDCILAYDDYYADTSGKFPKWDYEDIQPGPRNLLEYGGKKYMVANDHDGQVMYYRSDLIADPAHGAAFKEKYGYDLAVPTTWQQFRDVAEYFNGKDLNGDGENDNGLTMHLKVGGQGMFHFMSFSAPYVIGPNNPSTYWFDPETMTPLIDSPGHQRALESLVDLVQFGPEAMLGWSLGESWDYFLSGRAALTFSWGDLGALAQQAAADGGKNAVQGKTGSAVLPGTNEYYDLNASAWVKTDAPNVVGNTTGGSWAGVISKYSDAPEATYYLLALMATKEKSSVYAARGWDGADPGRFSHYLPPEGTASLEAYLQAGWDENDVKTYTKAYYDNFSAVQQFPYLRIPGTFEYWTALDVHLSEAVTGQATPEEALKATVADFEQITERLGRDQQKEIYATSLGLK